MASLEKLSIPDLRLLAYNSGVDLTQLRSKNDLISTLTKSGVQFDESKVRVHEIKEVTTFAKKDLAQLEKQNVPTKFSLLPDIPIFRLLSKIQEGGKQGQEQKQGRGEQNLEKTTPRYNFGSINEVEFMKLDELKKLATRYGIKGRSSMNKTRLIEAIREYEGSVSSKTSEKSPKEGTVSPLTPSETKAGSQFENRVTSPKLTREMISSLSKISLRDLGNLKNRELKALATAYQIPGRTKLTKNEDLITALSRYVPK